MISSARRWQLIFNVLRVVCWQVSCLLVHFRDQYRISCLFQCIDACGGEAYAKQLRGLESVLRALTCYCYASYLPTLLQNVTGKRVMRERLHRPMDLIRRIRWVQEQAAAKIQKWFLLLASVRLVRFIRRTRACSRLQCSIRMRQARQALKQLRRHNAAIRIQFFWRVRLPVRSVPWRRRRHSACLVVQTQIRGWIARQRFAQAEDAANLRAVQLWRCKHIAVAILTDAYCAYRARCSLELRSAARHIEHCVAPLVTRVVRGHLGRRAAQVQRRNRIVEVRDASVIALQRAVRGHLGRRCLVLRRRDEVSRHRAAFTLGAMLRRRLFRTLYARRLSGDTAAECVQNAWRQRRARKAAAASALLPFLQRAAASRVAPFFLVRVAEAQAGLAPGSICLHCLVAVAGGHSLLPCTSQMARKSGVGPPVYASMPPATNGGRPTESEEVNSSGAADFVGAASIDDSISRHRQACVYVSGKPGSHVPSASSQALLRAGRTPARPVASSDQSSSPAAALLGGTFTTAPPATDTQRAPSGPAQASVGNEHAMSARRPASARTPLRARPLPSLL